jgi:PEP-CTERM motif
MKKFILFFVAVNSVFIVSTSGLHALSLSFDLQDTVVLVGNSFNVDIVADIEASEAIIGWGLDLTYDTTQLSWDSVTVGSLWTPLSGDGDGLGGLYPPPFLPGIPTGASGTDVLLATLDFTCLALGTSSLDLSVDDPTEGFALDPNLGFGFVDWDYTPGSVANVPEPATMLLLGFGLAGLAGAKRKFKK